MMSFIAPLLLSYGVFLRLAGTASCLVQMWAQAEAMFSWVQLNRGLPFLLGPRVALILSATPFDGFLPVANVTF